jgi:hypothetical protein
MVMKKSPVEKLRDGSHKEAGYYDKAGRWWPYAAYRVEGSFDVRQPSREWPYGYLKHFYTIKYAALLAAHNPRLYLELQNISEKSETGQIIIAHAVAERMGVAA